MTDIVIQPTEQKVIVTKGEQEIVLQVSPSEIAIGKPTGGEPNLARNLPGGDQGVFAQKTGSILEFYPLAGVGGVSVSLVSDVIEISTSGTAGDVVGPASATDNALARFDTATGKLIQNSVALLDDAGALTGVTTINAVDITAHASRHENGGADEISVLGLSGLLADSQTPLAHAASHSEGGSDEVDAADLGSGAATSGFVLTADGAGGIDWLAGASTLQAAYDNATGQPHITLTAADGVLSVRDNATPIGTNLFEVTDNAGTGNYFAASATAINFTGGLVQSGSTRIDSAGRVRAISGSAGANGFQFVGGAGVGLFLNSGGIGFSTASTNQWSLNSSGNWIDEVGGLLVDGVDVSAHAADTAIHFTVGSIDHGLIAGLLDDDHSQYLLLAGRTGGQSGFGSPTNGEDLTLAGNPGANPGFINLNSPVVFGPYTGNPSAAYGFDYDPVESVTAAFIGGGLNFSGTITFTNGTFIYESFRGAPEITTGANPGFAAYTVLQALPRFVAGTGAGHNPIAPLVLNAGPQLANAQSGARTTATCVAVNWAGQLRGEASGSTMNTTNFTGFQNAPSFSTVAGSTIDFGVHSWFLGAYSGGGPVRLIGGHGVDDLLLRSRR